MNLGGCLSLPHPPQPSAAPKMSQRQPKASSPHPEKFDYEAMENLLTWKRRGGELFLVNLGDRFLSTHPRNSVMSQLRILQRRGKLCLVNLGDCFPLTHPEEFDYEAMEYLIHISMGNRTSVFPGPYNYTMFCIVDSRDTMGMQYSHTSDQHSRGSLPISPVMFQ